MKRDKLAKIFIFGTLVVSINILTVSVRWDWPWSKGWKKNGPLVNGAVNETFASPGHIHFWIYDDVTNNGVLDLQRKISIHMAFAPLLFWSLLSIP